MKGCGWWGQESVGVRGHSDLGVLHEVDGCAREDRSGEGASPGQLASAPLQSRPSIEPWPDPAIQGSSTSSSASSNVGLEEAQAGIKIAGKNINNLRYADDIPTGAAARGNP